MKIVQILKRKKMPELLNEIGKKGDSVLLKKLLVKNGCPSRRKAGNVTAIKLDKPMLVGHVVVRIENRFQPRSDKRKTFAHTSKVLQIESSDVQNVFFLETETSFYEVTFT